MADTEAPVLRDVVADGESDTCPDGLLDGAELYDGVVDGDAPIDSECVGDRLDLGLREGVGVNVSLVVTLDTGVPLLVVDADVEYDSCAGVLLALGIGVSLEVGVFDGSGVFEGAAVVDALDPKDRDSVTVGERDGVAVVDVPTDEVEDGEGVKETYAEGANVDDTLRVGEFDVEANAGKDCAGVSVIVGLSEAAGVAVADETGVTVCEGVLLIPLLPVNAGVCDTLAPKLGVADGTGVVLLVLVPVGSAVPLTVAVEEMEARYERLSVAVAESTGD